MRHISRALIFLLAVPALATAQTFPSKPIRIIATAMEWMPRGVTVLPRDIALTVASSGFCEVLDTPLPWRMPPVGMAWTVKSSKTTAVAALAAIIREEVGKV